VRALLIDELFTLDGVVHVLGSSAKVLHCAHTAALLTKGLGVNGVELERGAERVVEDVEERGPVAAVGFLALYNTLREGVGGERCGDEFELQLELAACTTTG